MREFKNDKGFFEAREAYRDGSLVCRVESFQEWDWEKPTAQKRFIKRVNGLKLEMDKWASIIVDSATFMDQIFRRHHATIIGDEYRARGGSTLDMEQFFFFRSLGWPCNFVAIFHVDHDKDKDEGGVIRYKPRAPGKLPGDLPSAFGEMYHQEVVEGKDGSRIYQLQTRPHGLYSASTQIQAPNPCAPNFNAMWAGTGMEGTMHLLLYGLSGSGKSTTAATFPTPILVLLFDAWDKAMPYLRLDDGQTT